MRNVLKKARSVRISYYRISYIFIRKLYIIYISIYYYLYVYYILFIHLYHLICIYIFTLQINWLHHIQKLFAPEGIKIKSSEKLIVQAYKYLTSLVPLLERTPDPIISEIFRMFHGDRVQNDACMKSSR